ncbi:hypothetical protein IU12_06320, partial [Mycobacterium tuberculosis]
LGGGLPIGACLAVGPAAELLTPGLHGSTFGGNPVCAAAALAVLRVLASDGLVRRAEVLGKSLRHGIEALGHPLIDHVRGRGLLLGMRCPPRTPRTPRPPPATPVTWSTRPHPTSSGWRRR